MGRSKHRPQRGQQQPPRAGQRQPPAAIASTDGQGGIRFELRADALPVPARAFSSTWAAAGASRSEVELVFGTMPVGTEKLNAALVIRMPAKVLRHVLYDGNPNFLADVRRYVERAGLRPETRHVDASLFPADRTVTEHANIAMIAQVDDVAEIRFYRISAFELQRFNASAAQSSKSAVDPSVLQPVVEVILSTEELAGLLDGVTAILENRDAAPTGGGET